MKLKQEEVIKNYLSINYINRPDIQEGFFMFCYHLVNAKLLSLIKNQDIMNTKVLSLALIGAALSFTACKKETPKEEDAVIEIKDTTTVITPSVDSTVVTTETPAESETKTVTASGKITEINKGKDGYTAKFKGEDGKSYAATISIPNLKEAKQYRTAKVGDKITVTGEPTNIEEEVLIKVTELQP